MPLEKFGSYELLTRLAAGGMAEIYLARPVGSEGADSLLVVKRILPHLAENADFVRMFLDEARIAARLSHPNIVQIFNLGAQDDSYFIAMEYIHGEDIRRVGRRAEALGKVVPIGLVCRVVTEACSGLDYAHRKADHSGKPLNIVHRDVSPQNILLTFAGEVKIVDFGIAKAADQATVTRSGQLKGKYSYMSPEQASGKKVDCRTDVFSLGIVLHELLTGRRLFRSGSDLQTLNAVCECTVPAPSTINSRVDAALDRIVLKALAKRPEDRYQAASALSADLGLWAQNARVRSSAAEQVAFMAELYTERLAREAREGIVGALGDSLLGASESASMRATFDETPERPQRVAEPAGLPFEAGLPSIGVMPTSSTQDVRSAEPPPVRPRIRRVVVASALVAVVAALAVATLVRWPRATITVTSRPAGATVMIDEVTLSELTPCALPRLSAGVHALRIGKAGYLDLETRLAVDRDGERTAQYTLTPKRAPEAAP